MRFLALLAVPTMLFLLIACGDEGEGGEVEVTLNEFTIEVDPASVEEGPVTFDVTNDGEEEHDLLIVRTSIPPEELPTRDNGSLDEGATGVDVVREIENIGGGSETSRVYSMDAGSYVLLDNTVTTIDGTETSFFAEGMWVEFTITEAD